MLLFESVKKGGSPLVHAETGQDISLTCDYELEDDILYSIKWYRDDKEFYRFRPRGGMVQSMLAASLCSSLSQNHHL